MEGEIKRANVEIWTLLVGGMHRTLEGPVVAGGDAPQGLNEMRRQLLGRIGKTPIPEDVLGEWRVVVKPVMATRESCVGCHSDAGKPGIGPPRINLKTAVHPRQPRPALMFTPLRAVLRNHPLGGARSSCAAQ